MQVTRSPPEGVLTTYAHKKGRSRVLQTSSSPVRPTDSGDLSLAEMTRRMKKRARQSINGAYPVIERGLTDPEKFPKRPKNTHAAASMLSSEPDSICSPSLFPLDSLTSLNDGTNNLQYQTPFNLSPVSSPTAPDPMSPVPPSRRRLSATGSRNLKENRIVKRLSSPFHSCSVSKACSRSGSRTNSPKKKVKKPPFYIKTRTRSEANAHPVDNVADEVLFPLSGSLPTLGSMKTAVHGRQADSSTAYMLQNLAGQDWFTPAKALSRSPFPENYIPPGTPFQEWDYSAETFLGGTPLQTSTPNVVKGTVRRPLSADAAPSEPNTHDFTHTLDDVSYNTTNFFKARGLEFDGHKRQHFNHDSIFSIDTSTTLSTSISRSNCMNMKANRQDHPALSTVTCLSEPGQAVVNLSGMLDCLEIDGMNNSSLNLVQRSHSLDSTQNTALKSPSSAARQTAGRRRDRASTIRASDYIVQPVIPLPSGGETSTGVSALTTRTRSGTIRPVRPPVASSASGFPVAALHSCAGQEQIQSGASRDPGFDKKSLGSLRPSQAKLIQKSRSSGVETKESMAFDVRDDESDDELLLDRKGWNWDGRWD